MNPSTLKLFNSSRRTKPGTSLPNLTAQMICKVVWLIALAALCVSCALAQNTSSGMQEFTANGKFTVPTGVTSLRIDAYGAGGGGGAGDGSFFGGGGGGGGYNAGVIQVSPGEVLTIVVGKGGSGGVLGNPGGNGSPGGITKIVNSSNVVVLAANAGKGGQGATSAANGAPGAGGAAGTFGTIRHAGQNGAGNSGAYGYVPVGFAFSFGEPGIFGDGGNGTPGGYGGVAGTPGYLLIAW